MQVQLVSTTGLTLTGGANGSATMTYTITITNININTALAGLGFTPAMSGAASLQIITGDQGNSGTLTDNDTIAITVDYGLFTTAANIGSGAAGPTSSTYASSIYTEVGNGTDIFGTSDQYHYLYKPWTGDAPSSPESPP
jgi:hypothetical protein